MGYYMSLRDHDFEIIDIEGAFGAIKSLAGETDAATSLGEALECWRWIYRPNEEKYDRLEFIGEKLWDDEQLFCAIAPFVKEDSYIEMEGGDGTLWRWNFKDGKCVETVAEWIWPEV